MEINNESLNCLTSKISDLHVDQKQVKLECLIFFFFDKKLLDNAVFVLKCLGAIPKAVKSQGP